ncbi:MAG: peptide chain release factor 1 [Deltaproteobacteria bacterium]|nr:peptide chain release factor 1 [Deltaproteobacteria bacterium]
MDATYVERLEKAKQRFVEIEKKLSDPKVISNPKEAAQLSKERSNLLDLVETYDAYLNVMEAIQSNQELLQDPEMKELAQEDLKILEQRCRELEKKLLVALTPKDPNDEKNIILEVRAGTGGEEASLFAAELFRMYQRYAEIRGWKVELLNLSETGLKGFKEVIAMITGDRVYSHLRYESGVHRVQRVPQTEAQGRIHTSAVTVAVLPEADEVEVEIQPQDLKVDVFRSSGPGGQSVNTTDSAVRMTHLPSGLVVSCQDEKSQHKNRAKALKILRSKLYDLQLQKQMEERSHHRKSQIGSGDRSEKIRTYNFPQSRVTDHRIPITLHNLSGILDGQLGDLIEALQKHFQSLQLKEQSV